jgi:hypothetical protein
MSKFLKALEPYKLLLTEQENLPEVDETMIEKEANRVDPETPSEIPLLTNDEIAQFIISLKEFYSQENPTLTQDQVDQIKNINPRDSREDSAIKASVDVLKKIFNVGAVQTSPSSVANSNFE